MSALVPAIATAPAAALRVLFVASEIYPLAKTGGLADVCAALPPALSALGVDVRLLMPAYPQALDHLLAPQPPLELGELLPGAPVRLVAGLMPDSGLPVWLVDCPPLFRRPGSPYQDPDGRDWPDNARRYGVLCHAAAAVAAGIPALAWRPDVVHGHDWHSGLVPLLLTLRGGARPRTVFTVHNAAFQGNYPLDALQRLGLPASLATPAGIEFHGGMSFLKAGVQYADRVTTVSPGYAREICTPAYGCGMEGVFAARGEALGGILNGIDRSLWDPSRDPCLPFRYRAGDLAGKRGCKRALQEQLGLRPLPGAQLAASVNRLTHQKMADVMLHALPTMLRQHPQLQFVLHGQGDRGLEAGWRQLAAAWPGRVAVAIGYSEALAHRVHAAADLLLHPSRFEPCGLTQLYAMRYGAVPVVRRVGGLADTVIDADRGDGATGFGFDEASTGALVAAVVRSLDVHRRQPERWSTLQHDGMRADFGWDGPARAYLQLYAELVPAVARRRREARQAGGRSDRTEAA